MKIKNKLENNANIYKLIIVYIYWVFLQIPLKRVTGLDILELMDEGLISLLFLHTIISAFYYKTKIPLFKYTLLLIAYFILNSFMTRTNILVSLLSIRDVGIIGIFFYTITKKYFSINQIFKIYKHLIFLLYFELFYSLFQIKDAIYYSGDNLQGTFGEGGAHTMGTFLAFFILMLASSIFISKNKNLKNWIFLFILTTFFYIASFRTLIVGLPIIFSLTLLVYIIFASTKSYLAKFFTLLSVSLLVVLLLNFGDILRSIGIDYSYRINTRLLVKQQSINKTGGRLNFFIYGYKLMQKTDKSIFFGNGAASFGSKTSRFLGSNQLLNQYGFKLSRNQVGITFSEIGILGLLITYGFYILLIFKFLIKFRKTNKISVLYLISILFLFLGAGFGVPIFESEHIVVTLWILILRYEIVLTPNNKVELLK